MLKIIKKGNWLYDGTAEQPVDIVGLDYDFWYEIGKADDQLEEGESPMALGQEGLIYYYRFQKALCEEEPTWVDSSGYSTIEEAMQAAQKKVGSKITWK